MKAQRILVPVKGDAIDDEAVQLAYTLAAGGERRGKSRVTIEFIYVIEVPRALSLDADLPDEVLKKITRPHTSGRRMNAIQALIIA